MSGLRRPHQELWNNMNGLNREDEHISEMSDSPPAAHHYVRGVADYSLLVHFVCTVNLIIHLIPYILWYPYPGSTRYATYFFFQGQYLTEDKLSL